MQKDPRPGIEHRTFLLQGNSATNCMYFFWRKPEYPVRTHACTGRTCKLHAERPQAGNRTQDLLAARQQCYQLRHHAA
ncbi:hypothetical protein ATANTOWER_014166 [Ataeniobius toweri]|uniref:Uncharacterized protein n=1 Tax=Ataeniobius toweri TaxID=208326 RepID=A0ABU7AFA2_9TELE|nr:hypothetical protein [Ataeniobius toweri]